MSLVWIWRGVPCFNISAQQYVGVIRFMASRKWASQVSKKIPFPTGNIFSRQFFPWNWKKRRSPVTIAGKCLPWKRPVVIHFLTCWLLCLFHSFSDLLNQCMFLQRGLGMFLPCWMKCQTLFLFLASNWNAKDDNDNAEKKRFVITAQTPRHLSQ